MITSKLSPIVTSSLILTNTVFYGVLTSSLSQALPPPPPHSNNQEYQFEAPTQTQSSGELFRVQVSGSSEQLLSLVRRVEPDAFVRDGNNVIQVGLFSDAVNAIQLVQSLSEQGVEADVVKIPDPNRSSLPSSPSPDREIISLSPDEINLQPLPPSTEMIPLDVQPPSPTAVQETTILPVSEETPEETHSESETESDESRGYYVIIPSRQAQFPWVTEIVQQVGVRSSLIQKRDAPRGSHVAVGPFNYRTEASRWSNELQTEGLDARVYFGR